ALATAGSNAVLAALANQYLGFAYHAQGDYHRAIDCLERTLACLDEAQHRERFGLVNPPAVASRARLVMCHAELGTFAGGRALGAEGLRLSEGVETSGSFRVASWAAGLPSLYQGDLSRAFPLLERAVSICQDANLPLYFPIVAAALGAAYTLGGRVADAVLLL